MNKPIRKVAIALAVLFLALFANLNVVQVFQGSKYRDDPGNRRVLLNEYSSPRGAIVVQGNNVAESQKRPDELKYLRVYPKGPIYAPATGYYSFTHGTSGIEDVENDILSGDSSQLFTTKLGNILTGRNPRGGSVQLTLNKSAQTAAYNAMKGADGHLRRGAVVALNPQTGEILAMVSTPSYDPNELSQHNSAKIAHAYACYSELTYPDQGQKESARSYEARLVLSIRVQLLLRKSGTDGFATAHKSDPRKYPLNGVIYSTSGTSTESVSTVPFTSQFPNFGRTGCSDVNEDPTWMYEQDHHAASPLVNRALRQIYPPGSVFKVIDAAAALKLGVKPKTRIPAPNSYWPLDPKKKTACPAALNAPCVENFQGETCDNGKTATLEFALAKSCNTAFAQLAVERIGGDALQTEANNFGLDVAYAGDTPPDFCNPSAFEIPLSVCRSSPGSQSDFAQPDSLAQTAFGQRDVRITPLQGAMLSAAVANNGTLMKPFLVKAELRPNLSVLKTIQPEKKKQVVQPDVATDLASMMEAVVNSPEGTGGPAKITSFKTPVVVGGKTGTADVGVTSASKQEPDAWFSGFALVGGQAKIAVAVVIENGGVAGNESAGGAAAGPVARKVMEAYLKSIGVS